MNKVKELLEALRGFDPEWDIVMFDIAQVPHPPKIIHPTLGDIRAYRKAGVVELSCDFTADNGHLLVLKRADFVRHMALVLERSGVFRSSVCYHEADLLLETFLEKRGIVYGHPSHRWSPAAAMKLAEGRQ